MFNNDEGYQCGNQSFMCNYDVQLMLCRGVVISDDVLGNAYTDKSVTSHGHESHRQTSCISLQ